MYKLEGWNILDNGLTSDDILQNGNRLLTGNGYLGRRGVADEAPASDMPATILSGVYDRFGGLWREPVNSPDPLFVLVCADDNPLMASASDERQPSFHEQALDFRYGIYSRSTTWNINGKKAAVKAQRYAHMEDAHLLCMRYTIRADAGCRIGVRQGINISVRDLNGPHTGGFRFLNPGQNQKNLGLECETLEKKIPLYVSCALSVPQDVKTQTIEDNGIFNFFPVNINLSEETEIEFFVYGAIYSGLDTEDKNAAVKQAEKALNEGWDNLLKRHKAQWDDIWSTGDVIIEGDDYAQACLRYSLYHLWIISPRHTENSSKALSIPARGLSGQTYKGAVFWDTEMFIAPYFRCIRPRMASQFIRYRINTLDGARKKAAEYGYRGAFYAWESQETGEDACSDFNVTDVFTGRPVRTYFRDKQIHISADIVYSIVKYADITGDFSVLLDGGMEVILESARFYLSYLYYSPEKKRYELLDVIGPDEYHERVNNNAFTNRMALFVFETVRDYTEILKRDNPSFIKNLFDKISFSDDFEFMNAVICKLYVPQPGENGVIEQFDGYFRHEDCTLETVRSRLKDPKEYWGCSTGVASATQIIKQADVAAMLALFPDDYAAQIKKVNLDFYEGRTEHGSSLSACMYALLSCDTGDSGFAYPHFIKSAEIDITGKSKHFAGLVYIGGTHPAANGGAWMTAIHGFCGFSIKDGEIIIKPRLPPLIKKIKFRAIVQGADFEITVTKDDYSICRI